MIPGWSVADIRAAERVALADSAVGELMQRAAEALTDGVLRELGFTGRTDVLVLAGPGNNGGDGLWAGARLATRGVRVWVHRTSADHVHQAGWEACLAAGGRPINHARARALLGEVDLVIDAVFGIGGHPGLSGPVGELAAAAEGSAVPVVSVDLPSGLAADEPTAYPSFRATRTVTFGAAKVCQLVQPAAGRVGTLDIQDIGLDPGNDPDRHPAVRQWDANDVAACWPVPGPTSDKYSRGVVGLDAGSTDYPGAGVLAAFGAAYAGAGMVRSLGAPEVAEAVLRQLPSVVRARGRVQAWVVGPGWGRRADGAERLREVLSDGVPVLVDADALGLVAGVDLRPECLLTPHAGELARLLGVERSEVTADPLGSVHRAADRFGATVLLKGATQYVAAPGDATVQLAVPGPGWTAQAGSGDTLAGVIGTLLAAGLPTADAAVCGASLQALTAAAEPPLPPHDLARRFGVTIKRLTGPADN